MKYVSRAIVGALLMAASTHSASAQVPALTNADITRLVAMHVSDQTVIAVIHEATTTHFDLSAQATSELAGLSTAIVAAMRQPSTPKPLPSAGIAVPEQSPAAGAQSIVEAAAEAAKIKHEWALSPNTGPKSPGPSTPAPTSAVTPAPAPHAATTGPTDAQLSALEESKLRSELRNLQNNYHAAKKRLAETTEAYNQCEAANAVPNYYRSCVSLYKATLDLSRAIDSARDLIVRLAIQLHMDPKSALEEWIG